MTDLPRLVLSYLGDTVYHFPHPDDDQRPRCRPSRIRGVPQMRTQAERYGLTPCPDCWPDASSATEDESA